MFSTTSLLTVGMLWADINSQRQSKLLFTVVVCTPDELYRQKLPVSVAPAPGGYQGLYSPGLLGRILWYKNGKSWYRAVFELDATCRVLLPFSKAFFSIHYFFAEGKKVKGWFGMEGVGGVGLDRWAGRYP